MAPSGLPRPVPVIVRQFTKEQMSKVIADKLKERQARDDLEHEKDLQWEDEVRCNLLNLVRFNIDGNEVNTFIKILLDFAKWI